MILDELTLLRPVRAAAALMATAILQVHEKHPDTWVLTVQKHVLALNIGPVQVMNLFVDEFSVYVLKGRGALPSPLRINKSFEGYRAIPTQTQQLYVDYEDFDTVPSIIREAFLGLASLAAEKVTKSVYRRHHAPHAVEWLSRTTGVHIPQPAYVMESPTQRQNNRATVDEMNESPFLVLVENEGTAGGDYDVDAGSRLATDAPDASDIQTPLVRVGDLDSLFLTLPKNQHKGQAAQRRGGRDTKATGDAAEALVVAWLRQSLPPDEQDTVHWVAQTNMTPGWDIEYTTAAGVRHVYEVKGTVRHAFVSIDISANEWRAAQRERELYHLVLVTSIGSSKPLIAIIDDPYGCLERNELTVEETAFRLFRETDEAAKV